MSSTSNVDSFEHGHAFRSLTQSRGPEIYYSCCVGGTNPISVTHIPLHDSLHVQLPTLQSLITDDICRGQNNATAHVENRGDIRSKNHYTIVTKRIIYDTHITIHVTFSWWVNSVYITLNKILM